MHDQLNKQPLLETAKALVADNKDLLAMDESVDEVTDATVTCLLRVVPAAVAGIAFLSGEQSSEAACAGNLERNAGKSGSGPASVVPPGRGTIGRAVTMVPRWLIFRAGSDEWQYVYRGPECAMAATVIDLPDPLSTVEAANKPIKRLSYGLLHDINN